MPALSRYLSGFIVVYDIARTERELLLHSVVYSDYLVGHLY